MRPLLVVLCFYIVALSMGCREGKKYHDEIMGPATTSLDINVINEALLFQQEMNEAFRNPDTSPLPDRYRMEFEGLEFFKPDSLYRVSAHFVRTPEAQPFLMPTTTDRQSREVRYGIAYFNLLGSNHELEVYRSLEKLGDTSDVEQLFLPFLDKTNGESTYAGGRYLNLDIPTGDSITIDFNKAYNPYCAYNKKYSCPIVPRVNALDIPIKAGVMAFSKP